MIVLLDHDDSFVHTLAHYVAELGRIPMVLSARKCSAADILALQPARVILSPGPGTPDRCLVALELLTLAPMLPVLGVCLGHQCIAVAFGAKVPRARTPLHGTASRVTHDGRGVFTGLPSPLKAARYHSLAVDRASLPDDLILSATADDHEVMGIRHRSRPVEGVQFHPESVLSEWGHRLIGNFLDQTGSLFFGR
ncbi:MAG TPA: aminodeoxychorismate/anthranilate synthase component II [Gemmatimonadales bacterium]